MNRQGKGLGEGSSLSHPLSGQQHGHSTLPEFDRNPRSCQNGPRWDQVLRYQPYVDGIGVCESHGAPKVFVFDYQGMETGWFFFNLLSVLTSRLSGAA